jgi:hypothetical protein
MLKLQLRRSIICYHQATLNKTLFAAPNLEATDTIALSTGSEAEIGLIPWYELSCTFQQQKKRYSRHGDLRSQSDKGNSLEATY